MLSTYKPCPTWKRFMGANLSLDKLFIKFAADETFIKQKTWPANFDENDKLAPSWNIFNENNENKHGPALRDFASRVYRLPTFHRNVFRILSLVPLGACFGHYWQLLEANGTSIYCVCTIKPGGELAHEFWAKIICTAQNFNPPSQS